LLWGAGRKKNYNTRPKARIPCRVVSPPPKKKYKKEGFRAGSYSFFFFLPAPHSVAKCISKGGNN